MDYGAITIDTSIFESNGLKLESGLLKMLSQFKESPAKLILSDIILRELTNHITKNTETLKGRCLILHLLGLPLGSDQDNRQLLLNNMAKKAIF